MYEESAWFAEEIHKIKSFGKSAAAVLFTISSIVVLAQYFCLIAIILGQGRDMSEQMTAIIAGAFTFLKAVESHFAPGSHAVKIRNSTKLLAVRVCGCVSVALPCC